MFFNLVLAIVVLICLFYGILSPLAVAGLCLLVALPLLCSRHSHGGMLVIDHLAQHSRLSKLPPLVKVWLLLLWMTLTLTSPSPLFGCIMALLAAILTVGVGGIPLSHYISLLTLPLVFLLTSVLALLFSYYSQPMGLIDLPFFQGYLSVTPGNQVQATEVLSRAFGAVSLLYLLALSTPMADLISALRQLSVPSVMIQLMYLIYRYIFLLMHIFHRMQEGAESRLGYRDLSTARSSLALICANLLARGYRQANLCFDAMESRGFDGEIAFLSPQYQLTGQQIGCMILSSLAIGGLWLGRI